MQCKYCRGEMDVLATHCPSCGRSQSILDEKPHSNSGDGLLDRVMQSIETDLTAEYRTLDDGSAPVAGGRPPGPSTTSWTLGQLRQATQSAVADQFGQDLATPPEEIQQMAQFVFYSGHVQSNRLYRERAARTTLHYLPDDETVNAFATDGRIPELDAPPPLICIQGGLTRVSRLVAAGLSANAAGASPESRNGLKSVVQRIGRKVVEGRGTLGMAAAEEISELIGDYEDGKRKSYNAAMNMTVIAHELGHIALGHTLGDGRVNLEISRNQEREADSFAASVASSSPFGDYIIAGGIFFWVIMAWIDAASGARGQTTHPHARERLMDYIRANREQAGAVGIDADSIGMYLP